jgi:SAM-dependent methyltransferase
MKHNNKLITLYGKEYFKGRLGDDIKRQRSFDEEKKFINKYVSMEGSILDVGCSTGEFLKYIKWSGRKYGIEISQFAAEKARQNGINIVNTYDANNSLDVVIYRGTIQHLDSPFRSLEKAVQALKPGGYIFFIATPNINSIYYKIFNTLPALDCDRNFYLPSDRSLTQLGNIFNLEIVGVEYPYINSPYSNPIVDYCKFLYKLLLLPFGKFGESVEFSFHGNMMNMSFRKKG